MKRIAITGSTGLIGSRIIELLSPYFTFVPLLQSELDITHKENTLKKIREIDFDILLHLAGYTNVDQAEKEKEIAYSVNVLGTQNLFEGVAEKKKRCIYISTDFVFDGTTPPYDEKNKPHPICYYGKTKLLGEEIIKDKGMIVRLSYPYRTRFDEKRDFVRRIIQLLHENKPLTMVTDSLFTPTFIDDIVYALKHLLENFSPEIFHLVGKNSMSPYEAGKQIAQVFKLNTNLIQPVTYIDYFTGKAQRPQFNEIVSKKNTFYPMKTFEEGLLELKHKEIIIG